MSNNMVVAAGAALLCVVLLMAPAMADDFEDQFRAPATAGAGDDEFEAQFKAPASASAKDEASAPATDDFADQFRVTPEMQKRWSLGDFSVTEGEISDMWELSVGGGATFPLAIRSDCRSQSGFGEIQGTYFPGSWRWVDDYLEGGRQSFFQIGPHARMQGGYFQTRHREESGGNSVWRGDLGRYFFGAKLQWFSIPPEEVYIPPGMFDSLEGEIIGDGDGRDYPLPTWELTLVPMFWVGVQEGGSRTFTLHENSSWGIAGELSLTYGALGWNLGTAEVVEYRHWGREDAKFVRGWLPYVSASLYWMQAWEVGRVSSSTKRDLPDEWTDPSRGEAKLVLGLYRDHWSWWGKANSDRKREVYLFGMAEMYKSTDPCHMKQDLLQGGWAFRYGPGVGAVFELWEDVDLRVTWTFEQDHILHDWTYTPWLSIEARF